MSNGEQLAVNAIRALAMDAVQRANSGHPGMPMGMADLATVLWHDYLEIDPADPGWLDRDRFVVSNGHGSMLLYALVHLSGFDLSMEDLRHFRQLGSPTPGHPELDIARGIETTTGPLGQGFSMGVGMALAESALNARFGEGLVDHGTFVFCSDGDLMEGVASEAASLAGHWELGKLVAIFDDNNISLEGPTDWTFTEDVPARFAAYGWHVVTVDGHDRPAIREALAEAIGMADRPTLVDAKTHIGYGSPNKQDTASAHGSPLGESEVGLTRDSLGWDHPPFVIPEEVYAYFAEGTARGAEAREKWLARADAAFNADPDVAAAWEAHFKPEPVLLQAPRYEEGASVATRAVSGAVIQDLAAIRPDVLSGDADLAGSTKSLIDSSADFSAADRLGRNVRYGVREHAMGSIVNGITLHGGMRAFGSTFLTFSDYMRGAVRLGALMETPGIWVWSHDSIFLGEDGPTHQPVEHIAALRAIPHLWVVRPADPTEVAGAWEVAVNRAEGPTAIILTRQGVPVPSQAPEPSLVARGAYIRRDGSDAVLIATGSEVWVAEEAAAIVASSGLSLRVVSMPCWEAFDEQGEAYHSSVLGDGLPVASLEAGSTLGWARYTGGEGLNIGIDGFGASAPWDVLAAEFGFTPEAVTEQILGWLR